MEETTTKGIASAMGRTKLPTENELFALVLKNVFRDILVKAGVDQGSLSAATADWDAIINRVFQPKAGIENFTNLRTPGEPEAKISASPGQSGDYDKLAKPIGAPEGGFYDSRGKGSADTARSVSAVTRESAGKGDYAPTKTSPVSGAVREMGGSLPKGSIATKRDVPSALYGPAKMDRETGYDPSTLKGQLRSEVEKAFGTDGVRQPTSSHFDTTKGLRLPPVTKEMAPMSMPQQPQVGGMARADYEDDEDIPSVRQDEVDPAMVQRAEDEAEEAEAEYRRKREAGAPKDSEEMKNLGRKAYSARLRAETLQKRYGK